MNLTIIGTGFVGVVSCAVFASFGNTVIGLDIDPKRVESLRRGKVPFYEPGLEDLLVKTQSDGNLSFTTSYEEAISEADVIMIAVGTPSAPDGQADLTYVFAACDSMAPYLKSGAIVAIKSTVPPGTCGKVEERIGKDDVSVVSLPEFLREGTAVSDTLHPDRVVIGASNEAVFEKLELLHKPLKAPFIRMKPESAQMCKYSANAYLATRITFINQIADLCEVNGANVQEVIRGISVDKRIGDHYWYPGLGYGGSCFPKDVKELSAYAKSIGKKQNLMVVLNELNEDRIPKILAEYEKEIGGFKDKKIAVLGLSFKPNTDDMREAPSTRVIPIILQKGAVVRAYDPMAMEAARVHFTRAGIAEGESFRLEPQLDDALRQADVVMFLVEWEELVKMDTEKLAKLVRKGASVFDTRNQWQGAKLEGLGLNYRGIGV